MANTRRKHATASQDTNTKLTLSLARGFDGGAQNGLDVIDRAFDPIQLRRGMSEIGRWKKGRKEGSNTAQAATASACRGPVCSFALLLSLSLSLSLSLDLSLSLSLSVHAALAQMASTKQHMPVPPPLPLHPSRWRRAQTSSMLAFHPENMTHVDV